MKKTTITIFFDEEKLAAIRLYMGQKGLQPEPELVKALEGFYARYVPANVREFLELREKQGREIKERKIQNGKHQKEKPAGESSSPGEEGAGGA